MMRNPASSVGSISAAAYIAVTASNQSDRIPFVIFSPMLAQNAAALKLFVRYKEQKLFVRYKEFVSNRSEVKVVVGW